MTPAEFKSWFDGFTECLSGTPTKAQWARIKERVAEIDGKPVSEHHYYRHYWPNYYWTNASPTAFPYQTTGGTLSTSTNAIYCSNTAMYALGKAESATA